MTLHLPLLSSSESRVIVSGPLLVCKAIFASTKSFVCITMYAHCASLPWTRRRKWSSLPNTQSLNCIVIGHTLFMTIRYVVHGKWHNETNELTIEKHKSQTHSCFFSISKQCSIFINTFEWRNWNFWWSTSYRTLP